MLWPSWWDEKYFCRRVAETNKLELLKWAREEKKCEWGKGTIQAAALQDNLEMVKYCVANECPINDWACAGAALSGHLDCLKYLHETAKAPWDFYTAAGAAQKGHLHILEYLVERKYDKYDEFSCRWAAENGHLDCFKYLRETAKAPWDYGAVREAHKKNQTEHVHTPNTCIYNAEMQKKGQNSERMFRSCDLWVMGPTRFRCASSLSVSVSRIGFSCVYINAQCKP